jgi:NitT/TauT family transport system substrate-binding protein
MGPNPAINAYARSNGQAVRIVSGLTSGGAALVVNTAIHSPSDLRGKKLADPQLGGTQDVALRWWLQGQGLKTDVQGGGDVSILPQDNATTLQAFTARQIDGAWVPEPWATRLVEVGGGKVLVDERSLWPGGRFATTVLVVRPAYLKAHPDVIERLLRAQVEVSDFVNGSPQQAQLLANDGIHRITGKKLSPGLLSRAWKRLTFTDDPIVPSLLTDARRAQQLGLLTAADLRGILDLTLLNRVLREAGQPAVSSS